MGWKKSGAYWVGIVMVLLLALFTMTSSVAFAHDQQRQGPQFPTRASLQNAPSGTAGLQWNPQSKILLVTTHLSGLQPGKRYAEHIHMSTCAIEGKILYPLRTVVADAAGNATATTTINNVSNGIPATGWSIMVHSGSPAAMHTLLCGNIVNQERATTTAQSVSVVLGTTSMAH